MNERRPAKIDEERISPGNHASWRKGAGHIIRQRDAFDLLVVDNQDSPRN
jgi:hypothetical protein